MFESLKSRIESLPEPERSARRALYSDDEWENLWELKAYPFQLPPAGDWKSWTIIGGRGVGKTEAGFQWAVSEVKKGKNVFGYLHHQNLGQKYLLILQEEVRQQRLTEVAYESRTRSIRVRDKGAGGELHLEVQSPERGGGVYDSVWADEIYNAAEMRNMFPMASKFVFSQPTILDPETIVSRAGDGRVF